MLFVDIKFNLIWIIEELLFEGLTDISLEVGVSFLFCIYRLCEPSYSTFEHPYLPYIRPRLHSLKIFIFQSTLLIMFLLIFFIRSCIIVADFSLQNRRYRSFKVSVWFWILRSVSPINLSMTIIMFWFVNDHWNL